MIMRREGEVVLIYYQDKPSVFARIESIEADVKKGWYHVTLLLLSIPTRSVTWILRDSYIAGGTFTIGGTPIRLEKVERVLPKKEPEVPGKSESKKSPDQPGKVLPFKKP
jgi:hypothetical protein